MKNRKILKPTILKVKKIKNVNGTLMPLYFNKINSFKTKRIFIQAKSDVFITKDASLNLGKMKSILKND